MDFSKTAIFSDLDGTLFSDDKTISRKNLSSIKAYVDAGGKFAISTGRIPSNLRDMLDGLTINGTSIVSNGSGLYNLSTREYLYKSFLDTKIIRAFLFDVMEEFKNADIMIYPGDSIVFITPYETADKTFVNTHRPCFFQNLSDMNGEWLKSVMEDDPENLRKIKSMGEDLSKKYNKPIADFVFSNWNYLEILPHDSNKGTALLKAKELPEYRDRTIFAIGDYMNDIELLEASDFPACPENALPEVKKISKFVTPDNNHDAIFDLIHFIQKI